MAPGGGGRGAGTERGPGGGGRRVGFEETGLHDLPSSVSMPTPMTARMEATHVVGGGRFL